MAVGGNEFDPNVMPSARAARAAEKSMVLPLPAVVALYLLVCLAVLGAVWLGVTAR